MRNTSGFMLLLLACLPAGAPAHTPTDSAFEYNSDMDSRPHPSHESTTESRTLSVRIDRPLATVYEFLVNPANWNQWAFGLGKSLRRSDVGWMADSADGIVKVHFTPRNEFAVLDHTLIRSSGAEVYVPMRLITNGHGCELLFTLFRESGISDDRYNADSGFVQRDLNRLKDLLEK
jgi:hypothetical protein